MKIINKPIEMIAQTSKDGTINPLRFRIEEDEVLRVVIIKSFKRIEDMKIGKSIARKYICDIDVGEMMKQCEIIYVLDQMIWYLYKM